MREMANCLNVLLVLMALPFCLLMMVLGLIGMVFLVFSLSPDRLPEWLCFIATPTFATVAVTLTFWYVLATQLDCQCICAGVVFFDAILSDGSRLFTFGSAGGSLAAVGTFLKGSLAWNESLRAT